MDHTLFRSFSQWRFLFLIMSCCTFNSAITKGQGWEKPYQGNDPSVLYYPDQNAVYFRYAWENAKGQGLVIKGKIPDARYFSYNLYNDLTKGSITALSDLEIIPDEGDPSSYTIRIVPEGQSSNSNNTIILPDSIKNASVFLRYYLANGNIYANRPLPALYKVKNGELETPGPSIPIAQMTQEDMARLKTQIISNPSIITGKERKILASPASTSSEKEPIVCKVMTIPVFRHFKDPQKISSYNFNSSGNYPNKDNHYILMPVVRKKKDDVLLVRFKAPQHAESLGDRSKDVRYFSLSEGDEYTHTSLTLHDSKLHISDDGFIYVAVGNDAKEVKEKAKDLGVNFMPWLHKEKLVLILRHMLPSPDFKQSIREVPLFSNMKPAVGQEAELSIGEYALIGKLIKKATWKSSKNLVQLGF